MPSAAILGEEVEIGELRKLVGAELKGREEEVKAHTFSIDELGNARDIYRGLTGTTNWEQMDGLMPRQDERNRINSLANERAAVFEDVSRRENAVREAKRSLAETCEKLNSLPPSTNTFLWEVAIDEIAAAGSTEEDLEKLKKVVQAEERRLADDFARLNPAAQGPWQKAAAQSVPLAEFIESFRQEFESAHAAIKRISDEKNEIATRIADNRASLIKKVGTESVPTADELTISRQDRDVGLHCIRLRLDGQYGQKLELDFTSRHAPGRSLIDAAEISVRYCDTIADRLRHEADRVAAYQSLQQQLKAQQARLESLAEEQHVANENLGSIDERWQRIWQPLGITADTPKVMQVWLTNWTKLVERLNLWHGNLQQCDDCKHRIANLRGRLSEACAATRQAKTLTEAVGLAKRAVADAQSLGNKREKLSDEMKRLQIVVGQAENDEAKAKGRRDEWNLEWTQAVAVLRLRDVSPSIETSQEYLKRIDQMQQHLRDMRKKDARVREITAERNRLLERVSTLRHRLDPSSRTTTAESIDADFRDLETALQAACAQRTLQEEFSKQLDDVKKRLGQTDHNLTEARAAIEALASEAGVEADAIPVAVQRARERAEVALQVRQYEEALAQIALGEPLETFIASALSHREGLDEQLNGLSRRLNQLDSEVTIAEADAGETERVIAGHRQASDAAADAQQKSTLMVSSLKDQVIEYAALHLALTALEKAKEMYRTRNQDTLLHRAGAFFKTLTAGAFSGIDIDNEEGSDVLIAVRSAANRTDARVHVSGLSDGTRDQLFLALRLAGIEHHLKDREPMPLIVDDVLINFDDVRARATLNCLAELAKKTQVILFTHHRHLVEIARTLDFPAVVHNLAPYF